MRLKSELYKKEQEEIIDKICNILDLENRNTYTLYELDNNVEIQKKIMELIPEIRKCSNEINKHCEKLKYCKVPRNNQDYIFYCCLLSF